MTNHKLWNRPSLEEQSEKNQSIQDQVIEINDDDILVGDEHIGDIMKALENISPMLQPEQSVAIEDKKVVKTKQQGDKKYVSRSTKTKK